MRIGMMSGLFLCLIAGFAVTQAQAVVQSTAGNNSVISAQTSVLPSQLSVITPASSRPEDIEAATNAWLATVSPAERARSDAYFEGGYWLQLWDFLIAVGIALLFLCTRLSAGIRNLAEHATRFRPAQTFIYFAIYVGLTLLVTFPMELYEGFFRERKYGLMNLTFGGWFKDSLIQSVLIIVFGGLAVVVLFGLVRKLKRTWWIWSAVFAILFAAFVQLIYPVWIAPLFNNYKKLEDPKIRDPILSLARANGVPANDVYWFDASRQSKRVSANVSGFFGTERISLNDNLLNRCTLPEILTVMGHEIGHYAMNHVYKGLLFLGVLVLLFFAYLHWALDKSIMCWGQKWGIRNIGDVAVLPLAGLLATVFFFAITPITNSYTRTEEIEADIYGLNAARQPDAEAHVDLMLGEYRKLSPTPLEEFLFFDHPSGRDRIYMAMRWKSEHMSDCDFKTISKSGITALSLK